MRNFINEEELEWVRSAVMFPIILDVLQVDIIKMTESKLKMKQVYIAQLKMLQNHVLEDIKVVKRNLKQRSIKILKESKTPTGYKATYICRGYDGEFTLLSNYIKSIVTVRVCEMMGVPISTLQSQ